jgi:hypothetical protein
VHRAYGAALAEHSRLETAQGMAADLRRVYTAATEAEAETRLAEFAEKWDDKFPMIAKSWRANWARAIPFFAPPKEIRKVIYAGLRHRVAQQQLAESNENPQLVPERRGRHQAALPGPAEHREKMDHAHPKLEGRPQSLRDHLRRSCPDRLKTKTGCGNVGKPKAAFPHSHSFGYY